jgi:hypothetical protein
MMTDKSRLIMERALIFVTMGTVLSLKRRRRRRKRRRKMRQNSKCLHLLLLMVTTLTTIRLYTSS